MKNKASIYVRNADVNPSGYYRICQYVKDLKIKTEIHSAATNGIYALTINSPEKCVRFIAKSVCEVQILIRSIAFLTIDFLIPPKYLVIQREVTPRWQPLLISFLFNAVSSRTSVIWDVDDDIFASGEISERERKLLEKVSSRIIVTHHGLKKQIPEKYWDKIMLLPTTDGDIRQFYKESWMRKRIAKIREGEIVLLWLGSSCGKRYLDEVVEELDHAAGCLKEKGIQLKLLCVTGIPFNADCTDLMIVNRKWSRKSAIKSIATSSIGIMPLTGGKFSEGKGAFKLIQYMSGGLPVIASDVGFNKEVVDSRCGVLLPPLANGAEWRKAIERIAGDKDDYCKYSAGALEKWKEGFDYNYNLKVLNQLLDPNGRVKERRGKEHGT